MFFSILFILIINQVAIDANVSKRNALDYLNKFGYVNDPNRKSKGPLSMQDSEKTLQNSLKKFQSIHGLKITGILDKATIKKIESPRCIKPDFPIARPSSKKGGIKMLKLGLFVTASKWKKKHLKYAVLNENQKLQSRTRPIIANAFKFWSDRSGIFFKEVHPNAKHDLSIKFGARNHGDAYPFDGPGGVLAHAFFPQDGRIHFDEDENFTEKTKNGINLQTVAVHEIGHALGLDHSLVKGAVMNPYYKGYDENFKLGKDDIKAIQSLYGKPKRKTKNAPNKRRKNQKAKSKKNQKNKKPNANPKKKKNSSNITTTKSYTRTTTVITKTTVSINVDFLPCFSKIQSFFIDPDSAVNYAILEDNSDLYRYDLDGKSWKKDSLKKYSNLPLKARGGIADDNGTIWFFNTNQIYAFKNGQILTDFPKTISDFLYPVNPLAAVYKNQKLYLFKNKLLYELNIEKLKIDNIHRPQYIFENFPLHLNAAFRHNGLQYFYNNQNYSIYDEKNSRILDGYPKAIVTDWSLCRST